MKDSIDPGCRPFTEAISDDIERIRMVLGPLLV